MTQSQTPVTLSPYAVESAYAFLHQKLRVYEYSRMEWQRDDIELAIADYVAQMDRVLYARLAAGRADYLCCHEAFADDMRDAVCKLEKLMA